jgi:hypothetical protein
LCEVLYVSLPINLYILEFTLIMHWPRNMSRCVVCLGWIILQVGHRSRHVHSVPISHSSLFLMVTPMHYINLDLLAYCICRTDPKLLWQQSRPQSKNTRADGQPVLFPSIVSQAERYKYAQYRLCANLSILIVTHPRSTYLSCH